MFALHNPLFKRIHGALLIGSLLFATLGLAQNGGLYLHPPQPHLPSAADLDQLNADMQQLAQHTADARDFKATDPLKKNINRSFEVAANAEVILTNKFGKVNITSTKGSTVSIQVDITVESENEALAKRIYESISVDIQGSANRVTATTRVGEFNTRGGKTRFSIDYTVGIPQTVQLNCTNKFGDVVINSHPGKSTLTVHYGGLNTGMLANPSNRIEVKFGKLHMEGMTKGEIELQYSQGNLNKATDLTLNSMYNQVEIGESNNLIIRSQYDKVDLGKVGSLNGNFQFTQVDMNELNDSVEADFSYGDFHINNVNSAVKSIAIDGQFGDLSLNMANSNGFSLDASSSFGDVRLSGREGFQTSKEGFTGQRVSGKHGNGQTTLNWHTSYGDIRVNW